MVLTVLHSTGMKACAAIGFTLMASLACAQGQTSTHRGQSAELALNHGKKWGADEVLRRGMDNIRQVMTANQDDIENGRLGSQDYQRLADAVDKHFADIVKNRKLTKESDTAFRAVLADLSQGAELMRTSPKIQVRQVGALGVLQSLRNYGEYFQHPGWGLGAPKAR